MPRSVIAGHLKGEMAEPEDLPRLAKEFHVSRPAMRIRLENLGLLAPETPSALTDAVST